MVLKGIAEPKVGGSEPQALGMSFGAGPRQVCCANGRTEDNLHREGGAVYRLPASRQVRNIAGRVGDSLCGLWVCMGDYPTPMMHIIYARGGRFHDFAVHREAGAFLVECASIPV